MDVGDDLIQCLPGEEVVSFRRIVAVAGRELVNEADRINSPELAAEDLDRPLGDLGERLFFTIMIRSPG